MHQRGECTLELACTLFAGLICLWGAWVVFHWMHWTIQWLLLGVIVVWTLRIAGYAVDVDRWVLEPLHREFPQAVLFVLRVKRRCEYELARKGWMGERAQEAAQPAFGAPTPLPPCVRSLRACEQQVRYARDGGADDDRFHFRPPLTSSLSLFPASRGKLTVYHCVSVNVVCVNVVCVCVVAGNSSYFPAGVGGIFSGGGGGSGEAGLHESVHLLAPEDSRGGDGYGHDYGHDYGDDQELGMMRSGGVGGYYDEDEDDVERVVATHGIDHRPDLTPPGGGSGGGASSGQSSVGGSGGGGGNSFAELENRRLRQENLSVSTEMERLKAENERYRAAAAAASVAPTHQEL